MPVILEFYKNVDFEPVGLRWVCISVMLSGYIDALYPREEPTLSWKCVDDTVSVK